jgi:uncharacterized protein
MTKISHQPATDKMAGAPYVMDVRHRRCGVRDEGVVIMDPKEREVISGIFERLKPAGSAPRDAEAEKFISEQISKQPYAPYVMAQSLFIQEQAMTNMQQQVEQLQNEVRRLQAEAQAKPAASSGGFLSGLFGGGTPARPAAPPQQMMPMQPQGGYQGGPQGGPWGAPPPGYAPQQQGGPWGGQQPQRQGGGFLASALTTAAGVAGGMVAGNMLMNAFSGGHGTAGAASTAATATGQPAAAGDTTVNNYYGSEATQAASHDTGGSSPSHDNASYDNASYDSGGMDDGGDSWA